ncbi:MAG: Zn-ribbon domain-containing OB-fold protein [Sulfolobaceae archaeon]|nr:Zn-ribbon domain-containing OB-fold protein [Sulfolobaceae archaeon]
MKIAPPSVWRIKDSLYNLIAAKCEDCGNITFPYQQICSKCGSTNVKSIKLSGEGTLIDYTVSYQAREGFEKVLPMYVGIIRLDEGFTIVAPLTDVNESNIKEGIRVKATLRKLRSDSSNGLIVYGVKFRPAEGQ